MRKPVWYLLVLCILSVSADAEIYSDDFSGDLSNWTPGSSHLDSYAIVNQTLFLDGRGHLTNPNNNGWGVVQFNQPLGKNFIATWDARIAYYDYANFVLYPYSPWTITDKGFAEEGYLCWMDINDAVKPMLDIYRNIGDNHTALSPNNPIPYDILPGETFRWKVTMLNGHLSVYINDVRYASINDATFEDPNYKIGLSFGEDSRGYIDNFYVQTFDFCPEGDFNDDVWST